MFSQNFENLDIVENKEGVTEPEHDEIVMNNIGLLGMGGVITGPNESLYSSHYNPQGLQIEIDNAADEDIDDEVEITSNKPGLQIGSGSATASIRNLKGSQPKFHESPGRL